MSEVRLSEDKLEELLAIVSGETSRKEEDWREKDEQEIKKRKSQKVEG